MSVHWKATNKCKVEHADSEPNGGYLPVEAETARGKRRAAGQSIRPGDRKAK